MKAFRPPIAALAAIALLCFMSLPSGAAVIGDLSLTNVGGGGVTVSNTLIDWRPPTGSGYGDFVTSLGTTITYNDTASTTASIVEGAFGRVGDLQIGLAAPTPFISFYSGAVGSSLQTYPTFNLTGFSPSGPSVLLGCSTVTSSSAAGTQCRPTNAAFPGGFSPFVLTWFGDHTAVDLGVLMVGMDASGTPANWSGGFTTQLPVSAGAPNTIETKLSTGGSVSNGYSAGFSGASAPGIPEPATSLLLGSGLIVAGLLGRRFRARR
jgi:hypothetical protein